MLKVVNKNIIMLFLAGILEFVLSIYLTSNSDCAMASEIPEPGSIILLGIGAGGSPLFVKIHIGLHAYIPFYTIFYPWSRVDLASAKCRAQPGA